MCFWVVHEVSQSALGIFAINNNTIAYVFTYLQTVPEWRWIIPWLLEVGWWFGVVMVNLSSINEVALRWTQLEVGDRLQSGIHHLDMQPAN